MSSIITHEVLYEILSKEKSRNEIQRIEESLFLQLQSYLREKELILESQKEKNSFPEEVKRTEKQLQSIKRLSDEIIEIRKRKITNLALLNSRTVNEVLIKNLLPEEKKLYDSFLVLLKDYTLPIIETKDLKDENPEFTKVKFLESIPKFMGTDSKIYGPFSREDMSSLPNKVAYILINRKKAIKLQ